VIVLPRVRVHEVGHEQRLTIVNNEAGERSAAQGPVTWLTLVVTQEQALQLAQAKWSGDLDVALLPPDQR
ncbi:MAG: hypothetical protein NTZ05_17635, partial [Chloroflexi bacterium]|nr:hypothetical protein [Chloroflexota bacterium]